MKQTTPITMKQLEGAMTTATKCSLLALLLLLLLCLINASCSWSTRALEVANKELDPENLLKRYEWFKDASAHLDKKQADIQVFEAQIKDLEGQYEGEKRKQWAREDRDQYNLLRSQLAGVKASFNQLAAEYNAAMAKINYRFTNVGDLPAGSNKPLPREYKPYETS